MSEELENLEKQIEEKITNATTLDDLNSIRVEVFGKKGLITNHLKSLTELPENERKEKGKKINNVKNKINTLLQQKNKNLSETKSLENTAEMFKNLLDNVSGKIKSFLERDHKLAFHGATHGLSTFFHITGLGDHPKICIYD